MADSEPRGLKIAGVRVSPTVSVGQLIQIGFLLVVATAYMVRTEGRVNLVEDSHSSLSDRVDRDQASTDSQLVELRSRAGVTDVAIAEIRTNSRYTRETVTRIEDGLNDLRNSRSTD